MPIEFPCPHCREQLSVNLKLAGKKGLCPVCREEVDVPTQSVIPVRKKFSSIPGNRQAPAKQSAFDPPSFPDAGEPSEFEYFCHQMPPSIAVKDGTSHRDLAASYLQLALDEGAANGWEFYRVDMIGIQEVPGCFLALLGQRTTNSFYYVVTFRRLRSS